MDGPHPPPHHSRSVSDLPRLDLVTPTTDTATSDTRRAPELFLPPNLPRRSPSDSFRPPPPHTNTPYDPRGSSFGETWMDFLRQSGTETNRGQETEQSLGTLRNAYGPVQARNASASGQAIEARKRRLTAPDRPYRRGSHGPSNGHGLTHGESSSRQNPAFGSSVSNAIDLTTPQSSPAPEPSSSLDVDGPSRTPGLTRGNEIVMPRWQPDSEVQKCPVCDTHFSFWYRKHHCRKCGRVVCANCSPHRITIPRQYIVQPPITDLSFDDDENLRYFTNSALGGGEEVRVCNPCVPDPNYNPPPQLPRQESWHSPNSLQDTPHFGSPLPSPFAQLNHSSPEQFSHMPPNFNNGARFGLPNVAGPPQGQRPDIFQDGRVNYRNPSSVADLFPTPSRHSHRLSAPLPPFSPRAPISHHQHSNSYSNHYTDRLYSYDRPPARSSHSAGFVQTPPGPPHPPQRRDIPEEDECPICGDELPPKGVDGSELAREAHVQECIATHFSGGKAPQITPPAPVDSTITELASSPPAPGSPLYSEGPSQSPPHPLGTPTMNGGPFRPRRMTVNRMLVYRATEKDCVGEDGEEQECVICFEEFKVGAEMGRLQCLCKFHRNCIKQWWDTKGVGSCPTHQLHE